MKVNNIPEESRGYEKQLDCLLQPYSLGVPFSLFFFCILCNSCSLLGQCAPTILSCDSPPPHGPLKNESASTLFSLLFPNSLKTTLKKKLAGDVVNLSGIPLSGRDVHRVGLYLQGASDAVSAVDLSFTGLQDDSLRLLLPVLSGLPKLTTLAVNGNRLTAAVLKDVTEVVKEPKKFPSLAWIDLGNNVDIFTVPQPLLVALRRRFGLRSSLPTIYEYSEAKFGGYVTNMETSVEETSVFEEGDEGEDERDQDDDRLELRAWGFTEERTSRNVQVAFCGR
ncbi:leucine-rich repeat-containing protein 75B-like [Hippocampus comes]|uniref:leucine-rich repeat-containing protein 75B-like n=1 Tax=Hippocampus comes TaxID=109280 RepID=UPI00094E0EF0|nr:PREDICTED: leucine-rich repeat-containing protein 75B-like [Hippocampus comes]